MSWDVRGNSEVTHYFILLLLFIWASEDPSGMESDGSVFGGRRTGSAETTWRRRRRETCGPEAGRAHLVRDAHSEGARAPTPCFQTGLPRAHVGPGAASRTSATPLRSSGPFPARPAPARAPARSPDRTPWARSLCVRDRCAGSREESRRPGNLGERDDRWGRGAFSLSSGHGEPDGATRGVGPRPLLLHWHSVPALRHIIQH